MVRKMVEQDGGHGCLTVMMMMMMKVIMMILR